MKERRHEEDDDDDFERHVVRPFMLTRGRTKVSGGVVMESLVSRNDLDPDRLQRLESVQRKIWHQLASMQSVAELSAFLELPLGVVLVLISDMSDLDLVQVHETASVDDVRLVRRLIDGILAL